MNHTPPTGEFLVGEGSLIEDEARSQVSFTLMTGLNHACCFASNNLHITGRMDRSQ